MSSVEKGRGFELKLAELFQRNGYYVTHDAKMKGRSGTEHQIDVLAEYKAPLHTSSVIIEAKSYQNKIDKDKVMKLIQIQQDLSVDRAILITTNEFTPSALNTARQYQNVELWDRQKVTSLLGEMQILDTSDGNIEESASTSGEANSGVVKLVEPRIPKYRIEESAREVAKDRSKGGLFGRGKIKEKLFDVVPFFCPYYDVDMEAKVRKVEKTGWFSKEEVLTSIRSKTGVDANTGALIHVTESGEISYEYSYLSTLTEEEIQLLYYVSNVKQFEKRNLFSIGWSTSKVNKLVNSLAGKGILIQTRTRPAIYQSAVSYPYDPSVFESLSEAFELSEKQIKDKKIEAKLSQASVSTAFEIYWDRCKVKSIETIYYPYYAAIYQREDDTKRIEIIDGIRGNRQEYLEDFISIEVIS